AYLDSTRGYFNGAAVFLAAEGRENDSCTLEIQLPVGQEFRAWRIATTLQRDEQSSHANTYIAANYDELIDHPVEMSDFTSALFMAGGVPHEIVLTGERGADLDRLAQDFGLVCQQHIDLFGGSPPFQRYLFLINVVGEGQGGLEHRSSTSLICRRNALPLPGMSDINDDYVSLLGLASHEYFHAWNIKRMKPAAFVPYDLSRESYTRQLWVFEGITSYYDDLALDLVLRIEGRTSLDAVMRRLWEQYGLTGIGVPEDGVETIASELARHDLADFFARYVRGTENPPFGELLEAFGVTLHVRPTSG